VVVLLGGAVAAWLLLSAAPAQADDAQDPARAAQATAAPPASVGNDSRRPAPALPAPVTAVVTATETGLEKTTRTVSDAVRSLPATTEQVTTDVTAAAPEPVRSSVATVSTAVTPTLASATEAIADTVDHTSTAVQGALEPLAAPADASAVPVRAMGNGSVAGVRGHLADVVPRPAPVELGRAIVAELGHVGNGVWNDVAGLPVPHAPVLPSSATGSWSGPVVVLFGLLLVLPLVSRRRIGRDVALLPLGPAYPPGSSPD
jgi:hypothetical protein